jgi:tRNA threonylcarbamoyladenosine biosynthesis protein TsaB
MAIILNIETATNICSVALSKDLTIISLKESCEEKSHARLLTVFIEEIFKSQRITPADLNAVSVSKGPGSYTGLRIGVATAKGLSYGSDIPLIAVSTLQAMAYGIVNSEKLVFTKIKSLENTLFCPMIDARRMEVYVSFFDFQCKIWREISADIIEPGIYDNILNKHQVVFYGSGSSKCKNVLNHPNAIFIDDFFTSAKYIAHFAYQNFLKKEFVDSACFEPYYLKDFIATKPRKNILK